MRTICKHSKCESIARKNRLCYQHSNSSFKQTYSENRKQYEKSIDGFLMRAYRNMKSRVLGIQKKKAYLYLGKELLPKEQFYLWAKSNPDFLRLYKEWVMCNYDQRFTPSVNRMNSSKGYTLDNIEFITNSLNSSLSSVTKKLKGKEKQIIYKILGVGK